MTKERRKIPNPMPWKNQELALKKIIPPKILNGSLWGNRAIKKVS